MKTANQLIAESIVETINRGKLLNRDHIQDIICDIISNEEDEEDKGESDQFMKSLEFVLKFINKDLPDDKKLPFVDVVNHAITVREMMSEYSTYNEEE